MSPSGCSEIAYCLVIWHVHVSQRLFQLTTHVSSFLGDSSEEIQQVFTFIVRALFHSVVMNNVMLRQNERIAPRDKRVAFHPI